VSTGAQAQSETDFYDNGIALRRQKKYAEAEFHSVLHQQPAIGGAERSPGLDARRRIDPNTEFAVFAILTVEPVCA
jgi:hypothetical protein